MCWLNQNSPRVRTHILRFIVDRYIQSLRKVRKSKKIKEAIKGTVIKDLGKRVEKYELLDCLALAQAGITLGPIILGDTDNVRRDLKTLLKGKSSKAKVNVVIGLKDFVGPNKNHVVSVAVYSKPV